MIEIQGAAILRDGENIGTIEGDTAFLGKKPGPAILGQIRKAAGKPELAFEYVAAPAASESNLTIEKLEQVKAMFADSTPQSIAPGVQPAQTDNAGGVSISGKPAGVSGAAVATEESGVKQQSASEKTGLERLLDLCEAGQIPAPPPLNPAAGDKCPLFREWFKTHATPEEYAAKYPATRKLPSSLDQLKAKRRQIAGEVPDTAD